MGGYSCVKDTERSLATAMEAISRAACTHSHSPSCRLGSAGVFSDQARALVGGIDPTVIIRWKDLFERLEDAIDSCENAAHILEGIAVKRA